MKARSTQSGRRVFVDTNLFLRYLTNDLPEQATAFERLLLRAAKGEASLVTNSLVIAEMVWTLASFYKLTKEDIQAKVVAILNTAGLEVIEQGLVLQAINGYVEKNVDFIDAYNAAWMTEHGIEVACSADTRHFKRFEGITVKLPDEV
jgi:uncharacterized protein